MTSSEFTSRVSDAALRSHIERVGTPCYLYFDESIRERADQVSRAVGQLLRIRYAFKANPHPGVVRAFAAAGFGADVASAGELQLALDVGYPPAEIGFSGPGKKGWELETAIRCGVGAINVESTSELLSAATIAHRLGVVANIGIRLNLGSRTRTGGLRMSGATQFGVSLGEAREMLRMIRDTPSLTFVGFHSHSASQMLSAGDIVTGLRETIDAVTELLGSDYGQEVLINMGGGWGVPYFENQSPLDLAGLASQLEALLRDRTRSTPLSKPIVELGRYLVAEAGIYVAQVLYRKRVYDKEFAVVDGGLHHNYILAGGMGQVIRRNFFLYCLPRLPRSTASNGPCRLSIAGCLCTPQDVLATDVSVSCAPEEGDYIIFLNVGAYGATASPQRFLSHRPPAEAVVQLTPYAAHV